MRAGVDRDNWSGPQTVDEDHVGKVGSQHPVTSRAAAKKILPRSGTQRRLVYDVIAGTNDYGATDDELELMTSLRPNSLHPRRGELADAGFIVRSGRKRKTRAGNDADVWVLA